MDANNQDKTENKTPATEVKPSTPPSAPANQKNKAWLRMNDKKIYQILNLSGIGVALIAEVMLIYAGFVYGWSLGLIFTLFLLGIFLVVLMTRFYPGLIGIGGYDKVTKEYDSDRKLTKVTVEPQPGKTLWDLLQLLGVLAIPIAVTIFGSSFSASIAEQQSLTSRIIAQDQEQETALQQYLDSMSTLLSNKDLQDPIKGAQLREIARARTIVVLTTLNGNRKGTVLLFLLQSNLINKTNTIVDLRRINLEGITLRGANLTQLNLSEADLGNSDLSGAFLNNTNLNRAFLADTNLTGANLTGADLRGADMSGAFLFQANLTNANLEGAVVTNRQLANAVLKKTVMPDGSIHP